jgi:hypothetical protein
MVASGQKDHLSQVSFSKPLILRTPFIEMFL